ncbi:hypothetical protein FHG87_000295 [Trinorchestia longiramus]|nr:hypothetical protein FHG87_000295 [Trinorchestia longiramus]
MNIGVTKHYSLLLQDDGDAALYEGLAHARQDEGVHETVMNGDFHTIIEEEEDEEEDEGTLGGECTMRTQEHSLSGRLDSADESDEDEEEIFDNSRNSLAHEKLKLSGRPNNDYHLLTNGDTDSGATTSGKGSGGVPEHPRLSAVWTPTPMSPSRRACVLASVMFGVLVTVVFVWVMPCGVDDLCGVVHTSPDSILPGSLGPHPDHLDDAWMRVFSGIGVNETVALVNKKTGREEILLSYYEPLNSSSPDLLWSSLTLPECRDLQSSDARGSLGIECGSSHGTGRSRRRGSTSVSCGLMLLREDTGERVWQRPLAECPTRTLCHLMSEDRDLNSNCLVIGSHVLIRLFNPHTDHVVWDTSDRVKSDSSPMLEYPGQPVLIPDVTGDSKPDLLFPGSYRAYGASKLFSLEDPSDLHPFSTAAESAPTTTDSRLYTSDHPGSLSSRPRSSLKFTSEEDTSSDFPQKKPLQQAKIINEMVLISGSNGKVVGLPYKVKQCHQLTEITIDGESIDYTCVMLSGSKLAGKIPVVSLIHQIIGPHMQKGSIASNLSYPSITPFLPTPDLLTNRYCQVEVVNTGHCPLCETNIKLLSTTEGENVWQAHYDASIILDWEPLISGQLCRGLVLKIIAWDDLSNTISNSFVGSVQTNNQRTTRSSFGRDDDEAEEDEAEEGFSAAGEIFEVPPLKRSSKLKIPPRQYLLQSDYPIEKRTMRFNSKMRSRESSYFNPPSFHVRHNRIKHNDDKKYMKFLRSNTAGEKNSYFGHPVMTFRSGKRNVIYEKNQLDGGVKFVAEVRSNKEIETIKNESEATKIIPKLAAVYSKEIESDEIPNSSTNNLNSEKQHSADDFELPIDIFGLPLDTQPPDGFALQRLTQYTMLVKSNGTAWVDVPLKKVPLFQLCKGASCIPDETLSRKLVVTAVDDEMGVWKVLSSVTTIAHGPKSLRSSTQKKHRASRAVREDGMAGVTAHLSYEGEKDRLWSLKTFVSKILTAP